MINPKQKQFGFSLIEMIVSLGVFSIVVTTAVGALLVIISANKQIQNEQSVMTNLSFALDSMTREMRTGYSYYCGSVANTNASVGGANSKIFDETGSSKNDHDNLGTSTVRDCVAKDSQSYRGVSFVESGNSITGASANRILYFYDQANQTIKRRVGNNTSQSIVSTGLLITEAQFIVTGSAPQKSGANVEQPTVTVYIEAQEKSDPAKTYNLVTTVTQRTLDI